MGAKVTAKVVLNPSEAKFWSRTFVNREGPRLSGQLLDIAKQEAPRRTGNLIRNLRATPFKMTGDYKGEGGVEVDLDKVPYAGFVMYGTRPHVIRARRAKALHFRMGGREVFCKSVNHPGTRPNRFMERALNRFAREFRRR